MQNKITPPQSIESEQALLACILLDKDAFIKTFGRVEIMDFMKERHQIIFKAILKIQENGDSIDLISVKKELEKTDELQRVGGASYLAEIVGVSATAIHLETYIKEVKKTSLHRKIINAGSKIMDLGYNEELDVYELQESVGKELLILNTTDKPEILFMDDMKEALTRFYDRKDGKLESYRQIGFIDFDRYVKGFKKSSFNIIAARPSVGKTTLMLNIALNMAKNNNPVGIISLEMSREELVDKLICMNGEIDSRRYTDSKVENEEQLINTISQLSEMPIMLDDNASNGIAQISFLARKWKIERNINTLFIDYIQLINETTKSNNRVEILSQITRSLKVLSRELNITIVGLSQLRRETDESAPRLSDLRESGSLEQDADMVLFLTRKIIGDDIKTTDLIVAKNRHGATSRIGLYFDPVSVQFKSKLQNELV